MLKSALPLLVSLAFLSACSRSTNSNDSSRLRDDSTPVNDRELTITIEHLPSSPEWRLTYRFSEPVRGFLFKPFSENYREDEWALEADVPVEWQQFSGVEFLRGVDDRAFTSFSATFHRSDVSGSYAPFIEFSDESVGILSEHLNGYLMIEGDDGWQPESRFVPTFVLKPHAGESVTAGAAAAAGELRVKESPRTLGIYFYFGNLKLETHAGLPILVDPAIPSSTQEMAIDVSARSFDLFTKEFGDLPFAASIYMRHGGDGGGAGGSASWGQFLVNIYGSSEPSEYEREVIQNAIVHETSHFWNALAYQGTDDGLLFEEIPESGYPDWIWEGGAQALTLEAMRRLGLLTEVRYQEKKEELLGLCTDVLGEKRVVDAADDGALEWAPYHCGELLQFLVVDLAKAANSDYDIFDLWSALFELSADAQYNNATFFSVVEREVPGIGDEKLAGLKQMLVAPGDRLPDLVEAIRE